MARNRVRSWDEPSFTMQAQARNAPQHPQAPKMSYISSSQRILAKGYEHLYRRLSVRECARIQTFPDNFKFIYQDVKDGYKMVGNAVPPRLAWYLAIQMKKAFADQMNISEEEKNQVRQTIKQIPIIKIAEQHSNDIINNENINFYNRNSKLELYKHVLICFVKQDNIVQYINRSANIYYTGKKFPSTIALNKLFYFMPYIKGKGIKDLYLIEVVRVGTRKEGQLGNDPNDFRLVFEIKFMRQLFDHYIPVHLNIWRTFTDTLLSNLLKVNSNF